MGGFGSGGVTNLEGGLQLSVLAALKLATSAGRKRPQVEPGARDAQLCRDS